MTSNISRTLRRMMSTGPTSHFITLPNRPIVQANNETVQGPLKLHYWKWKGHQPTILFCHAASFHGRCYDRIINEALRGFHVIALDFRGHGRSQQHPPPYRFRWFAEDVYHFIETLRLSHKNLIGIGHSVGGYALVRAAAEASKQLFHSLLLLDPVICPPAVYEHFEDNPFNADYILRRKSQWSSVEEMVAKLKTRGLFSQWPDDVLRDYCTYALDENFKLTCTPAGEASIYVSGVQPDSNTYSLIEKSKFINNIPIHIVRSSHMSSTNQLDSSPTNPDLVKCFQKGQDMELPNTKHLFPMEEPHLVVELINKLLLENKQLSHL